MSRSFRTADGGLVDRKAPLHFTFDGHRYTGFMGDTLASALLANGVHFVARSFKYHRPRGIFSAGSEEPNALIQIGDGPRALPNTRATQVELYDGLAAHSQNNWPSLKYDARGLADRFSRLLPAGFYYKTFMRPKRLWEWYESHIRRAAGMGRVPAGPDPDIYDKRRLHCDVLVVGGGPAGLAAALAAGRSGARVVLADEQARFGGSLLADTAAIGGQSAADWVDAATAELAALPEVRLLPRTTVFGYYDHNYLAIVERVANHLPEPPPHTPRERFWSVRARQVVLATGSHERPLVFAGNDRPGVMLAGAARSYLNRYGVRVGDRVALFTNNDSAYRLAVELVAAGCEVPVIADLRTEPSRHPYAGKADGLGIPVLRGHAVVNTAGRHRIASLKAMPMTEAGDGVTGAARDFNCDALLMSGGWNPALHLFSQAQGTLRFDPAAGTFLPGTAGQAVRCAGTCNGAATLFECLAEGEAAGRAATAASGIAPAAAVPVPAVDGDTPGPVRLLPMIPAADPEIPPNKHFVDFQNDVTAADIGLAAREGYISVEHSKRYTTAGMGTDQGKTSNVNALTLLAAERDAPVPEVGTTTFRPPYTPVTFGALAGRDIGPLFAAVRRTPMQGWHEAQGAAFEDVGQWQRPFYYPRDDETKDDAVAREVLAVRQSVGILDASTLGKIDIKGPDATALLDWVYTNDWDKLGEGRCRYGLMCGEDGMVFDDGVTARFGPEHYVMHTTSGNAERVLGWLEEWLQTEWPHMRVRCTSVTDQYATAAIAGPNARRLLAGLCRDIDLDSAVFPHMAVRTGMVAGLPARVLRVSYTGELSYEVNVPADYGMALWQALLTAGETFGIAAFGTEAMHVLRAEKGFILVGQDTDGTATPADMGMEWAVSKRKDFLGKRSLSRADMMMPDRKHYVGLLTEDPSIVLPDGAHAVETVKPKPPMAAIGHVTSSYFSPTLGRSIALAMIRGGRSRIGETIHFPLEDGRVVAATIATPAFYDPKGERMHG
ncbi:MAG: sarcosine oxidase subunit alpha family protein [Alphaproteobacteria bacterium]|nr:sarcosine oxidase subunit alpha family protein [Alphaproteobacteria bacterium]